MGTIAQKLQAVLTSKAAIKAAIEAKGVADVGDVLSAYASKILSIPTGGGGGGEHSDTAILVRWIDFDGTVLKDDWVEPGESATPPQASEMPTHPHLVFKEWNYAAAGYASITRPMCIGAIYDTEDDYCWLHINAVAGIQITIGDQGVTHNWGDGTTNTSNTHVYAEDFDGFVAVDKKATITPSNANLIEEYIPSGVTSIGNDTFKNCYVLQSVSIPSGVTSIGNNAFNRCNSLHVISIPSSVTSIGSSAFNFCRPLLNVSIPSGVTSFELNVFNGSGLRSISIPSGVTSIGGSAFSSCSTLQSVSIPSGVTSIGGSVFSYCDSLQSISIPSSVTSIGVNTFASSPALCKIEIPTGYVFPSGTHRLSDSTRWSRDTMVAFFNNLGATTQATTFNFGTTNLNKLSAADKAIATGKGYTLA